MSHAQTFTAFEGHSRVATGPLEDVAQALVDRAEGAPVVILDDATGQQIDLDLRGGAAHAVAEYRTRANAPEPAAPRQGRGRPKLGVVAREVTLLPRHWDWLATQQGGASAALRRLVEDARFARAGPERARLAREAVYRAMSTLAGDLPGFEEASRALFASDLARLESLAAAWPTDVRAFILHLTASNT